MTWTVADPHFRGHNPLAASRHRLTYYVVKSQISANRGWLLYREHHGVGRDTMLGNYPTRKQAFTAGSLLAGHAGTVELR